MGRPSGIHVPGPEVLQGPLREARQIGQHQGIEAIIQSHATALAGQGLAKDGGAGQAERFKQGRARGGPFAGFLGGQGYPAPAPRLSAERPVPGGPLRGTEGGGRGEKAIHGANLWHKVPGLKAQALAQRCPGEALGFLEVQGIENGARGRNKYRSARCPKGRLGLQIRGLGPARSRPMGMSMS